MSQARVSTEFQHVSDAASADVEAVLAARGQGAAKLRKTRIHTEENAPLIPPGSVIGFRPAVVSQLRPGAFVLVRRGPEMLLRRLVGTVEGKSGLAMRLATYNGSAEPLISGIYLIGEVVQVEAGGLKFNPATQRGLESLRNYLTDFNTCSPLSKLGRLLGRGAA